MRKLLVLGLLVSSLATPASAINLGGQLSYSFPGGDAFPNRKSPGQLWGAEVTFGLAELFELGAFYDYAWYDFEQSVVTGSGTLVTVNTYFYGLLARAGLPATGFYGDARVGISSQSTTTTNGVATFRTDKKLGVGIGAGHRWSIFSLVELGPRVGYRMLPSASEGTTYSGGTFDVGLWAQVKL
jgi:hypothetical protein